MLVEACEVAREMVLPDVLALMTTTFGESLARTMRLGLGVEIGERSLVIFGG